MNFEDHDDVDGLKIWLSQSEVEQLIEAADGSKQRIAFSLGARCGLRSAEIVDVAPKDVVQTDAGWMLRVWEGKGDKARETPISAHLATQINTIDDMRDLGDGVPVVDVSTRTLRRWIDQVGEQLAEETGEELWRELSMHDLRRTWATSLKDEDVDPLLVCDWGGWSNLETFLQHYRGKFSPRAQRRARESVGWL